MQRAESTSGALRPGLYDQVVSRALASRIDDPEAAVRMLAVGVDGEDVPAALAQYAEGAIRRVLAEIRGEDAESRRVQLMQQLFGVLAAAAGGDANSPGPGPGIAPGAEVAEPIRRLRAVGTANPAIPDTPLSRSALLAGTRLDPSLGSQLRKEIAAADRVDILCSFIRWSGLVMLLPALEELAATPNPDGGPRLRVISTSYMGATEPRALERLSSLPNTEVRVSYDTARTRLHAKAYVIHRETGFGSAYIGSANISKAAMTEGLEWTSKISQYELAHLWARIVATFDTYWADGEFEPFDESNWARLRDAINHERGSAGGGLAAIGSGGRPSYELRPFPFQEEILDAIAADRSLHGSGRHLVVSATGTGKTMVAAFDYRRFARERQHAAAAGAPAADSSRQDRPALLFVAHRREILERSLVTFRDVLRDPNFGDLLVGSDRPSQDRHLFCSVQMAARHLDSLRPERFDYVVIDEFHHAAAETYDRLLARVDPAVLLGLTATPERADGRDILHHFGGSSTVEIRLPDAIARRLLCPFQYFGITDHDSADLRSVAWSRGGYRIDQLRQIFDANDARAGLVLDRLRELVLDPGSMRALGFCVSVAHAEFMARFFREHGVAAEAVSADTPEERRRSVRARLASGEVNIVFSVDLYNEGVDIPEVDTILMLRPTESLTIFLQQLGRGLRLHDDKDCLTVLDFIGQHRREFRFASRFRALSAMPTANLRMEVESGFPHLPSGCLVQLERVAAERILENIKAGWTGTTPRFATEIGATFDEPPTIRQVIERMAEEQGHTVAGRGEDDELLDDVLRRGLWTELLAKAGFGEASPHETDKVLARGIRRLAHAEDAEQLDAWIEALESPAAFDEARERDPLRLAMLFVSLWGKHASGKDLDSAAAGLRANAGAMKSLRAVLEHRRRYDVVPTRAAGGSVPEALRIHARYTRDEVLTALGFWTMDRRTPHQAGVLHIPDRRLDVFFVTCHKTEELYSATTMYEDYAISDRRFHWQTQNSTSPTSETGRRYIEHAAKGYTPLFFVRERKTMTENGLAAPYVFLGPAEYVSHQGSKPMSMEWELREPIPPRWLRRFRRAVE